MQYLFLMVLVHNIFIYWACFSKIVNGHIEKKSIEYKSEICRSGIANTEHKASSSRQKVEMKREQGIIQIDKIQVK